MPEGAIYWYGNEISPISSFALTWVYNGATPEITRNTNSVIFSLSSSQSSGVGTTEDIFDMSKATKISFNILSLPL